MGVHVYPENEASLHEIEDDGGECVCGPRIEWSNPKTGQPYPNGPLVVHHAMLTADEETRWVTSA